jgi:hypothetical protein
LSRWPGAAAGSPKHRSVWKRGELVRQGTERRQRALLDRPDVHQMAYTVYLSQDNGGEGIRTGEIMTSDFARIGVKLMFEPTDDDALNSDITADRRGAAYVSAALGELGCRWLEAPLPDHDLTGYRELRRQSIVPILPAGEGVWDLRGFGEALACGSPWDAIRSDVSFGGGITFAVRLSAVARAFSLDMELASYGHAIVQAANLQAMLGLGSASYFEAPYPAEPWNMGVDNPLSLDPDGQVRAREVPGLGAQLDWQAITRAAVASFECGHR